MNIIIDYGLGNLASVSRAFEREGIECKISRDVEEIRNADSLILPGVGAFQYAMSSLEEMKLIPVIKEHVDRGKYLLGICLGMQLLYEKSYENGEHEGLGLIEGTVEKLDVNLKVPHMGWNSISFNKQDPILKYINEGNYVYFVHSYYIKSSNSELIAYGEYEVRVPAIVRKGNVLGFQFHPEKSGEVGANLIKAYREMIR
ncbi:imidazole glycerol phosphate synthase subunit HisH [Lutispora thermophila]|uniref:Imidazole glycerol phosphate synthase subunit HisH n=1 Tax=Lutispora thermophila DSM 19022 TaxID=1122184 RepID=A0A1M6FH90_9FIRM|nr:imidazole glycerol phosphate synthase subunit HisH [Lutispora thermophila]SHI96972.1 glutamine amidotransferase [Lutispora thermophila DSM 19022]